MNNECKQETIQKEFGKVVCIIQARLGSSRLPDKIMLDLCGQTVLQRAVERVKRAKEVDQIVIATTTNEKDLLLVNYCEDVLEVDVWKGDENDVLKRVADAAEYFDASYIVDITSDCPLVDPRQIDFLVKKAKSFDNDYIYVSNIHPRILPDGFDIQVYTDLALYEVDEFIKNKIHRRHTGWNIFEYQYLFENIAIWNKKNYQSLYYHPEWGLTLDTKEDYDLLKIIFHHFKTNNFSMEDVIKFILENPVLLEINKKIKRKMPGVDG